jgi:hypothetical protein
MIASETDVESPSDVSAATSELHRERVVVRKRRARSRKHHHHRVSWTARASRRRAIRAAVLCAAVLALMAVGVYFGLSRQNSAPAESSLDRPAIAAGWALA